MGVDTMIEKYSVFVNGKWHSDVEALDTLDAVNKVFDRGGLTLPFTGIYAELYTGSDEPEEDYHPRSLYGN